MTDEQSGSKPPETGDLASTPTPYAAPQAKLQLIALPGLIAISLYLLLLSVVLVVGAVGGHYPKLFLILPVFLLAAAGGLLLLLRWAWAMALSAVILLSGYHLWLFAHLHLAPSLIQGLLNLVFFLYLIRTEVREKLR
ncbi:hypothetical protein [Occallatibacter savannae]|uniref:hypothetical protein n=1 Tax=Occallatibacter savannae TaxID=1002691 RepID=UPI000D68D935|nr:hypothetical protein [Occallatibacter savannae]